MGFRVQGVGSRVSGLEHFWKHGACSIARAAFRIVRGTCLWLLTVDALGALGPGV